MTRAGEKLYGDWDGRQSKPPRSPWLWIAALAAVFLGTLLAVILG
jgi:hypothetical protein